MNLRLGTRGSALALAQSEWVANQLITLHPGLTIDFVPITTRGDKSQASNTPLSSYSEKGIFAKELEEALLEDEIDFAVHSMKDLAATLPIGLAIAAVPAREDPRDAVIGSKLNDLKSGATIGTGSVRRAALLRELRPDLKILEIRGNVDTRLRKLAEGEYNAIVLAVAGLKRLGKSNCIAEILDPLTFIPDPGQGALAIQAQESRIDVIEIVRKLNNQRTESCVRAERSYLLALGGGCSTPIGAWANFPERQFTLNAMIATPIGAVHRVHIAGNIDHPEDLGREAAEKIASMI